MRNAIVTPEGISVWALGAAAAVVLAVLLAGSALGVIGPPSAWLDLALRIARTQWDVAPA